MILTKVIAAFILPPGIFLLPGGIVLFILFKTNNVRLMRRIVFGGIFLVYLLSVRVIAEHLISPLEKMGSGFSYKHESVDLIVVLGAGSISRTPGAAPTPETMVRLVEGFRHYKKLKKPLVVCGGPPLMDFSWPSEAEIGKRFLEELGVNPQNIYLEETSRNTFENLNNLFMKFSPEKILLVTSAYHYPRVYFIIKNLEDVTVIPSLTDYKTQDTNISILDFIPSMQALHISYEALHEYLGILFYLIRY